MKDTPRSCTMTTQERKDVDFHTTLLPEKNLSLSFLYLSISPSCSFPLPPALPSSPIPLSLLDFLPFSSLICYSTLDLLMKAFQGRSSQIGRSLRGEPSTTSLESSFPSFTWSTPLTRCLFKPIQISLRLNSHLVSPPLQ